MLKIWNFEEKADLLDSQIRKGLEHISGQPLTDDEWGEVCRESEANARAFLEDADVTTNN